MVQTLLGSLSDLHYFQFNNEEKTVIDLSKFTLLRADKIAIGGCFPIFCSPCVREGRLQLSLKDIVTHRSFIMTVDYDHERDLIADLSKIRIAFRHVTRSPIEGSPKYGT